MTAETGGIPSPDPHYRHQFPAKIISPAAWLYLVFSLSLRDVDLMVTAHGLVVSYETMRPWRQKFGANSTYRLRRHRP